MKNPCDNFASFHPAVSLIYFSAVLAFSMIFIHPLCLIISLFNGILYISLTKPFKELWRLLKFSASVILISSLINPLFVHKGVTIIFYFSNGNPLTLEAIVWGIVSAFMLSSVFIWFVPLNSVMTADKIIFLFGKVSPSAALVLSMCIGFIPKFKRTIKNISDVQSFLYLKNSNTLILRIKRGICVLSSAITHALENSVETADSMKSRGYGTTKRTFFSIYSLSAADIVCMASIFTLSAIIIAFKCGGYFYFRCYPYIKGSGVFETFASVWSFIAYAALFLMPSIINITERIKWKFLISKTCPSPMKAQTEKY